MTSNKLSYTEKEIDELIQWFNGRKLPDELWIDKGTHLVNTAETVRRTIVFTQHNKHDISLLGYILILERIKDKLMELENNEAPKETGDTEK